MNPPESKPKESPDEFLSRWSRRKQQARKEEAEKPAAPPAASAKDEAPVLPPVEELGMDSDYSGFFHPKVGEDVRTAALRKLFDNPHFSVIDGMDIYLDDYSISEPIPAAMLKELRQAQNILGWAKEDRENEARREAESLARDGTAPEQLTEAAGATVPQLSAQEKEQVQTTVRPHDADDGSQNT
ncbi:MAG: DUF3306 domain-containing protein [Burkholderiales bacterium]